jgi:lipopolysaccharide export system permease protein
VRILSRYFAVRFTGLFAAILFASTLTIVIVEMLLNLDDMLRAQDGMTGVLRYLFLRIPSYYLRDLMPVAAFAASFFTLATAARWHETTAVKAGGLSPHRIVLPILATAALLALASLILAETWVVSSTRAWNRQLGGGGSEIVYRQGSLWYHKGHTIYNVEGAHDVDGTAGEAGTLRGVRIYELGERGRLLRSVYADRVELREGNQWRFLEATVRSFDPSDPNSTVEVEQVTDLTLEIADQGKVPMIGHHLAGLTLTKLREYVGLRLAAGEPAHFIQTQLHARSAEPVILFLFTLLAAPFGLLVERQRGFGLPALYGVVTLALFFATRNVVVTLSSEGVVPAAMGTWSVVGGFTLLGALHLMRIER